MQHLISAMFVQKLGHSVFRLPSSDRLFVFSESEQYPHWICLHSNCSPVQKI